MARNAALVPGTVPEVPLTQLPRPPRGKRVELPRRGEMFVRRLRGPRDAPTVVLLHGWVASGGLNWLSSFEPLRRHFNILAPDLRGHGRGIRKGRPFRLKDCADDVAALLEATGTRRAIVAGYSMGGPVAQLLWQRHPERVSGLVLCATSPTPVPTQGRRGMRAFMNVAAGAGRMVDLSLFGPRAVSRLRAATRPPEPAPEHLPGWALSEMRRHHWTALLEAGGELARHDARDWIQHIDVPTAVVVTERDWAIPANSQLEMAAAIPGASVHRLDDGHLACTTGAFGHTLTHACREVAGRDARGKRKRGRRKRG